MIDAFTENRASAARAHWHAAGQSPSTTRGFSPGRRGLSAPSHSVSAPSPGSGCTDLVGAHPRRPGPGAKQPLRVSAPSPRTATGLGGGSRAARRPPASSRAPDRPPAGPAGTGRWLLDMPSSSVSSQTMFIFTIYMRKFVSFQPGHGWGLPPMLRQLYKPWDAILRQPGRCEQASYGLSWTTAYMSQL